jgi:hypothetical protein
MFLDTVVTVEVPPVTPELWAGREEAKVLFAP